MTSLLKPLSVLFIGFGLAHSALAGQIDWDLSLAGIGGASAFTADALKATEVSHISFTGPTQLLRTWVCPNHRDPE